MIRKFTQLLTFFTKDNINMSSSSFFYLLFSFSFNQTWTENQLTQISLRRATSIHVARVFRQTASSFTLYCRMFSCLPIFQSKEKAFLISYGWIIITYSPSIFYIIISDFLMFNLNTTFRDCTHLTSQNYHGC